MRIECTVYTVDSKTQANTPRREYSFSKQKIWKEHDWVMCAPLASVWMWRTVVAAAAWTSCKTATYLDIRYMRGKLSGNRNIRITAQRTDTHSARIHTHTHGERRTDTLSRLYEGCLNESHPHKNLVKRNEELSAWMKIFIDDRLFVYISLYYRYHKFVCLAIIRLCILLFPLCLVCCVCCCYRHLSLNQCEPLHFIAEYLFGSHRNHTNQRFKNLNCCTECVRCVRAAWYLGATHCYPLLLTVTQVAKVRFEFFVLFPPRFYLPHSAVFDWQRLHLA